MQSRPFTLMNSRGLPLRGDVMTPRTGVSTATIVICHGFKGFKEWGMFPTLGGALADAGFTVVLFNFSGSGIGDSSLVDITELDRFAADTISAQVDDLGEVIDALQAGALPVSGSPATGSPTIATERIGVLGHSRGGATALIRAHEDGRIRCLVTWAAVSHLLRWSEREMQGWQERGYMEFLNTRTQQLMRMNWTAVEDLRRHEARFDLLTCARGLQVPWLLLHGQEDLSVRLQEGEALEAAADARRTRLQVIPQTGHTFGAVHPWQGTTPAFDEAVKHSIQWFSAHLGAAPGGGAA
jgi:pimeloyl-ACP methyl ester carboxylesterase